MVTDITLDTQFAPKALYFHDSDCVEYLRADASCVFKRVDETLTLALEMDSRTPIGFRIKGFKNIYLKRIKPLHEKLDNADFVSLVSVLEQIVQNAGDNLFDDEAVHEAYRTASKIARTDKVELYDLPNAA